MIGGGGVPSTGVDQHLRLTFPRSVVLESMPLVRIGPLTRVP
jgi:hypothetical protein